MLFKPTHLHCINKGKLLAFVDLTVSEVITVKGFKIFDGSKGRFVGFPDQKQGDKYFPTVVVDDKEVREMLSDSILSYYREQKGEV